jgi:hypothetical protein
MILCATAGVATMIKVASTNLQCSVVSASINYSAGHQLVGS